VSDDPIPDADAHAAATTGLGAAPKAGSTALLAPGEVLAGRFRIVRFLGRGGMGEVYEAQDLDLRERVALKTIRPELSANDQAMEHFRREIHLARKVTHPNVCRIFDLGRHHERTSTPSITFLTMELLDGETLEERLAREGRMTGEAAASIAGQVAGALAAAHGAGIVHRDLKPGNVILEARGDGGVRAVVTDFGLACLAGEAPSSSEGAEQLVVGTAAYMSPEQAAGKETTPASDIFSFGLLLYELVTGRRALREGTFVAHAAVSVPPPRDLVPDLDPRWDAAIVRCLEREPARRFASVAEAAQALGVEHSMVVVSRRGPVWIMAAALAIALAAGGWLWWRARAAAVPRTVPVQVTTTLGIDLQPSFSPDGRSLAYASNRAGNFKIYVQPMGPGGHPVALTREGDSFEPAFSPDGQSLAFHRRGGGIWLMPAAGGAPRRLTEFGSRPSFSPDGALVVFQSEPLVDLAANAFPALPPSTLWLVPAKGGAVRALTRPGEPPGGHGAPSWSRDGKRIVFGAADRRLAQIWSVGVDGKSLVRLLQDQPYASDPVFSADGRHLFYSATSRTSTYGLWRMPVGEAGQPSGPPVELVNLGALRLRHLTLSRDGRRLAYSALALASNLWSVRLGAGFAPGERPRPLTSETGKSARPSFSPDGATIAFDRGRPGVPTDIWTMAADGSAARALTTEGSEDNLPSWFPDGSRLAFASDRGGRFAVWAMDVSGGATAEILSLDQDVDWPRLSPDGTRVAFNSRKGSGTVNVWVAPVGGGEPRQLTFDREIAGFPAWSPDGRTLALEVKRGDDMQIAVLPADGGPVTPLTSDPGQAWPYSWSPDGTWIVYAGQRDGVWNVWAVNSRTREQRRLTNHDSPDAYVRTPAVSPRGDLVVYEYAQTMGNVWMVEIPVAR
jgi:Tol biopolymer transport system component